MKRSSVTGTQLVTVILLLLFLFVDPAFSQLSFDIPWGSSVAEILAIEGDEYETLEDGDSQSTILYFGEAFGAERAVAYRFSDDSLAAVIVTIPHPLNDTEETVESRRHAVWEAVTSRFELTHVETPDDSVYLRNANSNVFYYSEIDLVPDLPAELRAIQILLFDGSISIEDVKDAMDDWP